MGELMEIYVRESKTKGALKAPSSKSQTHRALICSLLSEGTTNIYQPLICEDTEATLKACRMFGAEISVSKGHIKVKGKSSLDTPPSEIDCGESASTLRMLLAPSALCEGSAIFTGRESLLRRPVTELVNAMEQLGIRSRYLGRNGYPPVEVLDGTIKGGNISIRGDISSQYISSLLFVTPFSKNDTRINITGRFESSPYVNMTMDTMRAFGVEVSTSDNMKVLTVKAMAIYRPLDLTVEGDYSSAAFLMVSGCINGDVKIENLKFDSKQGDKAILGILQAMGAEIIFGNDWVSISTSDLRPINLDCSQIPDLVPVLTVLCTQANGISTLRNIGRLRIKESDRISAIYRELIKMGADINVSSDMMEIKGGAKLNCSVLESHNDHRIAMALIVAALAAKGNSTMRGVECISKSYPSFLEDMKGLGADIDVI